LFGERDEGEVQTHKHHCPGLAGIGAVLPEGVGLLTFVYLTDPEGYRVIVFSATGEPLAAFGQYGPEDGSFGLPNGLALGPDGSLWIVDAGNNRVVKYPPIQP